MIQLKPGNRTPPWYLVSDDDVVPVGPELVEGEDVEPGALVAGGVEVDAHGVLLQEGRKTLVHSQVLVRLQMEKLEKRAKHGT